MREDYYPDAIANVGVDRRAQFITRTYGHLFGAIIAFAMIEVAFFKTGVALKIAQFAGGSWLLFIMAFMVVSWLARSLASSTKSLPVQYAGLAIFVFFEAVLFAPLLYMADAYAEGVIDSAAIATLIGFAVLTAIVFVSRKDFSFLQPFLMWGGFCALGLIIASMIFGFQLGMVFSVGMVAFAGAAILFDTSKIIHQYGEDQYVGAALELFASVALMFWYVIQIFMRSDD